jgi:hypothetical protein
MQVSSEGVKPGKVPDALLDLEHGSLVLLGNQPSALAHRLLPFSMGGSKVLHEHVLTFVCTT